MGHHIIIVAGRSAIINDTDLFMARHFLVLATQTSDDLAVLRPEFLAWKWIGPGVWIDENLDVSRREFARWPELMSDAIRVAEQLAAAHGTAVPVAYLKSLEKPDGWRFLEAGFPVQHILRSLTVLRDLVASAGVSSA